MFLPLGLVIGSALAGVGAQPLCSDADAQACFESPYVVGGRPVKSCQWPSAMIIDTGRFACSGTLIHRKIFVTAAHCLMGNTFTVLSGDGYKGEAKETTKRREVEYCRKHPDFKSTQQTPTKDFAYCKLKEEITDVAPMPIMMGCELDYLKNNPSLDVTVVGFGYIKPRDRTDIGRKYEVVTKFHGFEGKLAKVGDIGKGPLKGDSGGPVYVRLPEDKFNKDAGWRVFGITSTSRGPSHPDGRAYYGMIHTFVEYLEKDSGVDVTPCTDAKGNWEPTKDCKGAFADPYAASGDWINGCEPSPPGGYISSCGKPFADEPEKDQDTQAPKVEIASPKDGQRFDADTDAIKVRVTAQDEGEIKEVGLWVNGKAQDKDRKSPYVWTLRDLEPGTIELRATAVDDAGNEGESATLEFELAVPKGDKQPEPDDETGSTDEDDDQGSSDQDEDDGKGPSDSGDEDADRDQDDDADDDAQTKPLRSGGCELGDAPRGWGALCFAGLLALGRRRSCRR